jgi:hypothetical protein
VKGAYSFTNVVVDATDAFEASEFKWLEAHIADKRVHIVVWGL